jgi:uncharacterized protein (UPF0303 family)
MATTGNFSSSQLLADEEGALLSTITIEIAQEIGELASTLALERNYPITISIELNGAEAFRAALPGSSSEHDSWIIRKARVVNLTGHSTMYERVKAEEDAIDWHLSHGVEDATHAIHGGGFPLISRDEGFEGVLLISGLPQVEDHNFAVEVLSSFISTR